MSIASATIAQWFIGITLIGSAIGVITFREPVHACLSFMMTLIMLAALYLQLSAEFTAVMQILVYAGAILVIFMFVIVLFQDAHAQIEQHRPQSKKLLLTFAAVAMSMLLLLTATRFIDISSNADSIPKDFGTVQALGHDLYVDFFFPFEAVVLLFLIALVGALYIGRKNNTTNAKPNSSESH